MSRQGDNILCANIWRFVTYSSHGSQSVHLALYSRSNYAKLRRSGAETKVTVRSLRTPHCLSLQATKTSRPLPTIKPQLVQATT